MMTTPMPDMNPETTEYGVYAMNLPSRRKPNSSWIRPARTTIVKASARS